MAGKGKGQGKIRSKKKAKLHVLDQMRFKNRTQEKVYDKLAEEFVAKHLPKIMYIVPTEVREENGDDFNTPGKLFKDELTTINTKDTYLKRIKTYIKWQVINEGISSLGDITQESNDRFFKVISENIGTGKSEYSKKTYDSYVDGTYKFFTALAKNPTEAKVDFGRELAPAYANARIMLDRDYKQTTRDKVDKYSKKEYKRGSGYNTSQASTLMRAAEKNMSTKDQFLVALLVHGGLRNDETHLFSLDCINTSRDSLDLLKKGMTKQDRGRSVLHVHPKIIEIAEKLKEEGVPLNQNIFEDYDGDKVRDVAQECCRFGKIKYSGVHDLRKSFVEKTERELHSAILKGKVTKEDLVKDVMTQVGVKPSLNPLIEKKMKMYKTEKGKRKPYWKKVVENGEVVKEPKFSEEKLRKMNIEDLADLFVSQQLGHSDPETTHEYRMEKAAWNRKKFRVKMKKKRQKEESK